MPIYEFECCECGSRFERLAAAGTEAWECPDCGSQDAERRMSMFGVTTRQPTPRQRRRLEAKRETDRGGARKRFQRSLDRSRATGSAERGPKSRGS